MDNKDVPIVSNVIVQSVPIDPDAPVKKKRGRKPKSYYENLNKEEIIEPPKTEVVHKKRGRKPKGGKIVQVQQNIEDNTFIKKNVILHLKCNLNDISNNNDKETKPFDQIQNINNFLSTNVKLNDLNYHIIDNKLENVNNDNNSDNSDNNNNKKINNIINENNNNVLKDNIITNNDYIQLKDNKIINGKLKELQTNLHMNDISDKTSACFWCTYEFDNSPIYIPKYKLIDTYKVYGCFCSPECALSFLMKENIDISIKYERCQLLNYIYSKIFEYKKSIKPAPDPYYLLDKYYGNLSIQEYRTLLKNDYLLMIIDKPLTRILPELHEENNNFLNHNNNHVSSSYKIKKKKETVNSKNNILQENFGL